MTEHRTARHKLGACLCPCAVQDIDMGLPFQSYVFYILCCNGLIGMEAFWNLGWQKFLKIQKKGYELGHKWWVAFLPPSKILLLQNKLFCFQFSITHSHVFCSINMWQILKLFNFLKGNINILLILGNFR